MLKILQAGRAFSAIGVVGFHLSGLMASVQYGGITLFRQYTKHGDLGVNFFFVLSGFIILFAHEKDIGQPHRWKEYIYKRFVRVFPIYWLYTALFIVLLIVGSGNGAAYPHSFPDWATSLTLLRFSNVEPPLKPAWTLFHEVGFYLIFSTLLLNKKMGIVLLAIFVTLAAIYFRFPAPVQRTAWNVYTAAYNLDFIFGMISYWLYKNSNKWLNLNSGIALFIFSCIAMPLPAETDALFFGMAFALVLAGAAKTEADGVFKVPAWLSVAGDASYSIYLTHIFFQIIFLKISMKMDLIKSMGPYAVYIVILISSILSGIAAYMLIERPLLVRIKKWRGKYQ